MSAVLLFATPACRLLLNNPAATQITLNKVNKLCQLVAVNFIRGFAAMVASRFLSQNVLKVNLIC